MSGWLAGWWFVGKERTELGMGGIGGWPGSEWVAGMLVFILGDQGLLFRLTTFSFSALI